jgi:hypothetical protein
MTAQDIEIRVADHFNPRLNLLIPNISWGLLPWGMEVDLLLIRPSGWAEEIEIKITAQDIKRDFKKPRHHPRLSHIQNELLRRKYFAVPEGLAHHPDIPAAAGILSVSEHYNEIKLIRPAALNKRARKLTVAEIEKVMRLGCMRIWTLKRTLRWKQLAAVQAKP